MTTQRETKLSYTEQQAVIRALYSVDEPDLAARLGRCMTAHRSRHHGDGRSFSCQSAACLWCRRAMLQGWWAGICDWAETASSLVVLSIGSPVGLPNVTRHLRRAIRDVRDRVARSRNPWREVGFAGLLGGDRRALVIASHQGIERCEVLDVMRRRWPDVIIKKLGQEEPTWKMFLGDAAELGRCHRGVEPLRVVVMPQQEREMTTSSLVGSMPVLVG
jgi:hypothetical protein